MKNRLIAAKQQARSQPGGHQETVIDTAAVLSAHTEAELEKEKALQITDEERAVIKVEAEVTQQLKVMFERQDRVLSVVGDAERAMEVLAQQLGQLEGAMQPQRHTGAEAETETEAGGGAVTSDDSLRLAVRSKLLKIYAAHRPEKIEGVDELLEEWHGDEMTLLAQVSEKYKIVDPGSGLFDENEESTDTDTGKSESLGVVPPARPSMSTVPSHDSGASLPVSPPGEQAQAEALVAAGLLPTVTSGKRVGFAMPSESDDGPPASAAAPQHGSQTATASPGGARLPPLSQAGTSPGGTRLSPLPHAAVRAAGGGGEAPAKPDRSGSKLLM